MTDHTQASSNSESATTPTGAKARSETSIDLRPTLFIGIGGTGMEVLMRLRRRILNTLWGDAAERTRVQSLADFPVAQFIQYDLDSGAVIDNDRAQAEDLQFDLVKFSDEDKIVETFDMDKYSRDDDALEKYPHIKEWLPLTPKKIRELGIDPAKGAGQIRAVSRLYFFDKYAKVRDKIRLKLKTLKAGLSHEKQLAQLGLKMETTKFRVVLIGSVAGGTGSGAFIDMGMLARWLAKTEVGQADVELMLLLPTGFAGANKDRTEANGYAALMELEAAMMGNKGYIGRWDAYDLPELPREPFNEVYLIDSGNLAQQHTRQIKDVYHMVADALFEDFAAGDFARRKRSVAVNQAQHKNYLHDALVPKNRFADMRLSYAKRYSAFGQAVLDTQLELRADLRAHRWAGEMLKTFFGVGVDGNRATDQQRDDFMVQHMRLRPAPFSDLPEFSDKNVELKRSSGEFTDYFIVDDLLQDSHGLLLAGVEHRVNARLDEIRSSFDRKEWPAQVREAVKQLERDAVRDQDTTADTTEDRVTKRRRQLLDDIKQTIRTQLYAYLDNKQYGGLEYVLSLVEQVKDRLEAPGVGLITSLKINADRYREIKEAVRTRELERLLNNLEQTRGGFFGSGEKQALTVLEHLRLEIANGIKFHLRAKAADEAALLMGELSDWLGRKAAVDAQGKPVWTGLVGEVQTGRNGVLDMLSRLNRIQAILQQDLTREHATHIIVPAPEQDIALPAGAQLREWADEAFMDLGGSKVMFPMLQEPSERGQLLLKVKRMAQRKIAQISANAATQTTVADPLIDALEHQSAAARLELFRKLLSCAMPWVDGNLTGDFSVRADQYKCFIGVARADEFSRKFRSEIEACVPTQASITAGQVAIVETGVPGRAVCYTELSGIPLTMLRGLEGWRTSYRKESEKSPPHTHIDSTQFSHPLAPTTDELNRLAEDFKHYLLAVMLGILTRSTQRFVPPGQYQFAVARGDVRRIGNERAIRQNGLPTAYKDAIMARVNDQLANAGPYALIALTAMADDYENAVYTPKLVADATGAEQVRKGFASAIALQVKEELHDRARRKGVSDKQIDQGIAVAQARLKQWASPIADSDEDAYDWEVREPGEDGQPRLKYTIMPQMLDEAALQAVFSSSAAQSTPTAIAPALAGAMPPPLQAMPPTGAMYHLGINGQQYGPFDAQQIGTMFRAGQFALQGTKVWRTGMSGWVDITQFAELVPVLQTAPPSLPGMGGPGSMPPPLN